MPNPRKSARILVVDDQLTLVRPLADQLGEAGYTVVTCASSSEALAALHVRPFDLVITDLRLHGASGFDLIEAACRQGLFVPVLILSALRPGEVEASMRRGAHHYLVESLRFDEMLAHVESALDTARQVTEGAGEFRLGRNGLAAVADLRRRAEHRRAVSFPEDAERRLECAIQFDLDVERTKGASMQLRAFTFGLHARAELLLLRLVSSDVAHLEREIRSDVAASART